MNNWSDAILTFAAQAGARLGPVTRLIDTLTNHLVAPSFAEATICPSVVCSEWCAHGCNDSVGGPHTWYTTYGWNWQQCAYGSPSCTIGLCYSC